LLGVALVIAGIAGGSWTYGYRQALDALAERSAADLALASDRVSTQLQIYQELAVLMVEHPVLKDLHSGQSSSVADAVELLRQVADKTAALDVFYVSSTGQVLAAAEGVSSGNVASEEYFKRAMQGALGSSHGVLSPQGRRVYNYAAPSFEPNGAVLGALVVVADVEDVEQTWRGSLPTVIFTDRGGKVFISNRPELFFWQREAADPGSPKVVATETYANHEIWTLDGGPYLPRRALHLALDLPVIGLTGQILVDVAPARRIAALQSAALGALSLAFGAFLFLALERRRTLAEANAVLESRVEARTRALQSTNTQLRHEIRERKEAEAALQKAQEELVQAGKLSALGQMSAGISHELNQPLMAIQQYAENAQAFLVRDQSEKAGENLGRIAGMSTRMARIIKNLRAFSRNESEPRSKVDLIQVINAASELTAPRLQGDQVALSWEPAEGEEPLWVWGGEVRLTQVFVNLINNAADAMLGQEERAISIEVEQHEKLSVRVTDVGPGIKEPEKMFDPFYSTKVVGSAEGMGLGLSISYGLVQSFGGNIRGLNSKEGGAIFEVELEPWRAEAHG